ncbi:putative ADP-ribosyl glycohydrolase [Acanthamoeba polyphaga mimivirus]|nr:putative ADP-ribosyl glycohydrolase [Mimivirus reunion]WMV61801.1 putative ADP-ribosyl glycohydrolase [Mimivirus sp.]WMV62778.1 putative ADP-ribosyl glycohydrolase [Acanthamoeba polyphaga mimivirus]WMV63755.1 putative ADP-ribosyl glycohydrolase [Mimivirus sp.]
MSDKIQSRESKTTKPTKTEKISDKSGNLSQVKSSKNLSKSQSIYLEIDSLSKKFLEEGRQYIYKWIRDEYGLSKNEATALDISIYNTTIARMINTYKFDETLAAFLPFKFGKEIISPRQDFYGFATTCGTILYYQSFGDTLGYYNGNWEFNYGNDNRPDYVNDLISEFIHLGGINDISMVNWLASDDTILYLITARVVLEYFFQGDNAEISYFGTRLRQEYLKAKPLIQNRHPGQTTMDSLDIMSNIEWDKLPYNSRAIGAGAAMRSGSIGIFYPGRQNRKKLVALAVECSRITHNSATAILGSVTSALFTAFSLEKISVNLWPHYLLEILRSNIIDEYIEQSRPNEYSLFSRDKVIFQGQWEKYVSSRFSGVNPRDLRYMHNPVERYRYLTENFSKGCDMPGGCGDDCVIMAYDSLLQSNGVLEKVVVYSILHPGDSDTVGSVALSWFGAYYSTKKNLDILSPRFDELEYSNEINNLIWNTEDFVLGLTKVFYKFIYIDIATDLVEQSMKLK